MSGPLHGMAVAAHSRRSCIGPRIALGLDAKHKERAKLMASPEWEELRFSHVEIPLVVSAAMLNCVSD